MKPLFLFISTIVISKVFPLRRHIWSWLSSVSIWNLISNTSVPVIVISPNENFISTHSKRFLDTFQNTDKTFNDSIDSSFYDKNVLSKLLNEPTNDIESQWKRRVLIENTPYGNIIMLYSPYKMGFEYYSDTSSIPYSILNATSMKYCIVFFCRDFFVDNSITPDLHHSKLIPIHYMRDKPTTNRNNNDNILSSKSFAKFKNYQNINSLKKTNGIVDINDKPHIEAIRNRFIYLGKTCNYSIIPKTQSKSNSMNGFYSKLLDNIDNESGLQQRTIDYKSFKKSIQPKTNDFVSV